MRHLLSLLFLFLLVATPGCPGCRPPNIDNPHGIYDCTAKAVTDHGIALIPKVNDCLVKPDDWVGCLISLINPAVGITEEVLACVVRASERAYSDSVEANANDAISALGAQHARQFLHDRGYQFR